MSGQIVAGRAVAPARLGSGTARFGLAVVVMAAAVAASRAGAVPMADAELGRLLRAMAALKLVFAAAALAAMWWRLAWPVGWVRLGAYGLAAASMAAGPVLIWNFAHLRLGALLLHAGLLAAVLLLWRDPAVGAGLAEIWRRRRAA